MKSYACIDPVGKPSRVLLPVSYREVDVRTAFGGGSPLKNSHHTIPPPLAGGGGGRGNSAMMSDLLTFSGAVRRDPEIEEWCSALDPMRHLARDWFVRMRNAGPHVRELFHDGCPVVCVADAPFAYVNAFRDRVNIGFYRGADLA